MWTAKKGDERKKEFIETAIEMFKTKGYEKTSINDILRAINVTKGAFYYYFSSKEELLDAIIEYLTHEMQTLIKVISDNEDLSAVAKLEHIFCDSNQLRKDNALIYRQLYELQRKDENAYVAKKFMQNILNTNVKYIQTIIDQGIEEGIFNTTNPKEMAELYIRMTSLCKEKIAEFINDPAFEDDREANIKKINDLIIFYQNTIERVLGASNGTLDFLLDK
ncbi:TetR/AcrR family transcriptional regulator [Vallitalea maricola]|uniref:TetR/AcrR family transcriptional regulator n=1 Tax=Vallitalea maricola TaxID=3074433 RepID=A0ACB5URY0_9FIRM|nr:TetR/AcrR family transcriptional regulator [Vallitalea sp. AN17-2]